MLLVQNATGQAVNGKSSFTTTEYQSYDRYYERITYLGKRKDHYIVDTYLTDSTLYRVDNYKVIDQGLYIGLFAVRHGPTKILYADGRLYLTCDYNMNDLNGPLTVYYNNGAIKRKELYRNGKLKKSMCYDTAGAEQVCDAFYQRVQFMGNTSELKVYLEKNLQPILEGNPALVITISLIINEIGQVVDVKMDAGRANSGLVAAIKKVIQDMPRWRENQLNWKAAVMDGVPIPGSWVIYAQRDRSYWRVSFH